MKGEIQPKKWLVEESVTRRPRVAELEKLEPECDRVNQRLRTIHHFLEVANRHRRMAPLLEEYVSEVKEFTGCDSVGIRILDEEGNIPYQAYEGFSQQFYKSESPLSIKVDQCMCINVIKGVTEPKLPYYTKGGSFYTSSTTRLLPTLSDEEKGQTRNVCNQYGYESVALIPISLGGRILGLIHVADHREDMVALETVETLEEVAMQLGTAVQRVWAEEELQESEERYRALLNLGAQVGEAVVMLQDNEQGIATQTFVSDMWPRVTGYPREELLEMSFFDLVHPGNLQASIDRHHRRMAGESIPGLYELSIIRKDGTEVPIEVTSAYTTYKGQRANVVFIREIAERKRMEEALRRSKERYHSLFENSPISLWEEDWSGVKRYIDSLRAEGNKDLKTYFSNHPEAGAQCAKMVKVIDVNRASLDLYKATTKEELFAGLDRVFGEESYNSFIDGIVLSADGHTIVEDENITRTLNGDKNHIAVKWALLPGYEETWARVLVTITDITERKRVEQALRESEQKYRTIFETTGTAMCIDEEDTTISLVNRECEKLLGYSKEELEGKKSWTEFIVKEDLEWIEEQHRLRRISPDDAAKQYEARVINKRGEVIHVLVSANAIPGTKKDVVSLLDITERKQVEQELRRSESQHRLLSQRVIHSQEEERARIARELHDQLGQELVATKIEAISLAEQLANSSLSERALTLVNSIERLIGTVHRTSVNLRPEMLDKLGFVQAACWYAKDFEQRTKISCPIEIVNLEDAAINNSKEMIIAAYRILQEALTNVWQHAKATQAQIRISKKKNNLIISVSDNGVGMDTNHLTDETSLGLLGMRERALFVGGTVKIRSRPNLGTEVTARLPIANPESIEE